MKNSEYDKVEKLLTGMLDLWKEALLKNGHTEVVTYLEKKYNKGGEVFS